MIHLLRKQSEIISMASRNMTRRDFLGASSLFAAGLGHAGLSVFTTPVQIPTNVRGRRHAIERYFPESPAPDDFRALARIAMDAAESEGAEFADIRIGVLRHISVPEFPLSPSAGIMVGYGIRARVRGMWGFQHGSILAPDAIASAARSAVRGARRYAAANTRLAQRTAYKILNAEPHAAALALAPAPVVSGEWKSPCDIDPFTVALDDYYRVMGSMVDTMARVHRNRRVYCDGLAWTAETRIFASTAGSLITQHFMRGGAGVNGVVSLPDNPGDQVSVDLPGLGATSAGFEAALQPDRVDYVLTGMDEAVRLRELPRRAYGDVGRFPVVFAGAMFADLVGATVNLALDSDRIAGREADASGTSFFAPPAPVLNAQSLDGSVPILSPLLTLTVNRTLPSTTAVKWDDEGVVPEPYTAVEQGHIVDYHTSRETASLLADWYAYRKQPMRAHGGVVAPTPASLPVCSGGHVTIAPSMQQTRLEDLIRDMSHGFVIRQGNTRTEPGLTAGMIGGAMVLEVIRGRPVARTYLPVQFVTKPLLKDKLVALGDISTARTTVVSSSKGLPWQEMTQPVTAPAALCKDVDVFAWPSDQRRSVQ